MKKTTTTKKTAVRVLVLRTVAANMTSPDESWPGVKAGSFKWPKRGLVTCKDWDPSPQCGGGLHGLLWGQGDAGYLRHTDGTRKWLVVECFAKDVVDIGGTKCKFRRGKVLYCGTKEKAVAIIQAAAPDKMTVFGTSTSGNYGKSTSGD